MERIKSGSAEFEKNFCAAMTVGGAGYVFLTVGLGFPGVNVLAAAFLAAAITCISFGY